MIDWNRATREDVVRISSIAKKAKAADPSLELMDTQMDLEACHTHGCPLDLDRMVKAKRVDLMHDVYGIQRHLDRETGELRDCFVPRFARAE